MTKKYLITFLIFICLISLTGCSKTNIFGWVHKGGGSEDKDILLADGNAALNEKDFNDALTYFDTLIQKNPDSAEGLYGWAIATMGVSGLSLADIIASVVKETQTGVQAPALASDPIGKFFVERTSGNLSDLLPSTLNLANLYATAIKVIPKLAKIADGHTDGTIPANDVDVNVNLALMLTIRAVCRVLDTNGDSNPAGSGDIVEVYSDFTVKLPTQAELDALTHDQLLKLKDQVDLSVKDVLGPSTADTAKGAVDYLVVAINTIGAKPDSPLGELKKNIDELKSDTANGLKKLKDGIDYYIANGVVPPDWQ